MISKGWNLWSWNIPRRQMILIETVVWVWLLKLKCADRLFSLTFFLALIVTPDSFSNSTSWRTWVLFLYYLFRYHNPQERRTRLGFFQDWEVRVRHTIIINTDIILPKLGIQWNLCGLPWLAILWGKELSNRFLKCLKFAKFSIDFVTFVDTTLKLTLNVINLILHFCNM